MSLIVYNTLSRRKEEFVPSSGRKVGMYVCGVTVYDEYHLGHARAYVGFDCIRRYLEYRGHDVRCVQNFTDVDDLVPSRHAAHAGARTPTARPDWASTEERQLIMPQWEAGRHSILSP